MYIKLLDVFHCAIPTSKEMFSQAGTSDEKKLNWMYQGANSLIDREDYLLGKTVDKSLEQLNLDEKPASSGTVPKNHVEHECIPPSIRDYKQQQLGDQVDIQAKLQEDPLIAIKKREEESRRQFLQNPVQIAKLQKALRKREKKLRKSKKHKLGAKLAEKIKQLTGNHIQIGDDDFNDEAALDIILMHKFNSLRSLISEEALQRVLKGEESNSSSSDEDDKKTLGKKRSTSSSSSGSSCDDRHNRKHKKDKKFEHRKVVKHDRGMDMFNNAKRQNQEREKQSMHQPSTSRDHDFKKPLDPPTSYSSRYRNDSDEEASSTSKNQNFGLVRADGTKIELMRNNFEQVQKPTKKETFKTSSHTQRREKLSEEEKEKRRLEMLDNATWREKERYKNIKRYMEEDAKESKESKKEFDKEFVHKELLKSVNSQSVESRIKANRNNIQRGSGSMNSNFSKR